MRAGLAAGLEEYSAAKRLRVQAIDGELVRVERGLDQLYDLERPGVERQAERRARIACSELAARRVEAVRWALAAQGVPFDDDRVHVARGHVGDVTGDEGGRVVMIVRTKRTK